MTSPTTVPTTIPTPTPRSRSSVLQRLHRQLVVSCQALPPEPLHGPQHMVAIVKSVVDVGAAGVRVNGIPDLVAVRAATDVPVIGLWKAGQADVKITPTLTHAVAVADAGADIVALDGTRRPRPDGRTLAETITGLRATFPGLVMADVATVDDALAAQAAGADIIGTTLSGYTADSPQQAGPDLDLVSALVRNVTIPVFAEGRIGTPEEAAEALTRGAHTVVVGGAITRPAQIARRFLDQIDRQVGKMDPCDTSNYVGTPTTTRTS